MRNFFIIGHNPNTVADALRYLQSGANALEPDVHFTNNDFYVGEGTTGTDLLLSAYLQGLSQQLTVNPRYTPALIMFDTKSSDGNILSMLQCIQTNFSAAFPNTAIVITRDQATADEHMFFSPAAGHLAVNGAVGVDENTEPEMANAFFRSLGIKNFTFGDGISIPLLSQFFWNSIKRAVAMRDAGGSFRMVYAWTLDTPLDINSFLKLDTDGMITDSPGAVKEIVESAPFAGQYQLAPVGYNPFS
jgi:hypothetical protein